MHDCKDLQGETDELQEYLKSFLFFIGWLFIMNVDCLNKFHQDKDQSNRIASTYQAN